MSGTPEGARTDSAPHAPGPASPERVPPSDPFGDLTPTDTQWLETFLDNRARNEDLLLGARATYFVALMTALVAAEVAAQVYGSGVNLPDRFGRLTVVWIPPAAAAVSVLWAIVMARTVAAQHLWREALWELEGRARLLTGTAGPLLWEPKDLISPSGSGPKPDMSRPSTMHRVVFSERPLATFRFAFSPNTVWEILPWSAAILWTMVALVGGFATREPQAFATGTIFPLVVVAAAFWEHRTTRHRRPDYAPRPDCPLCREIVRPAAEGSRFFENRYFVAFLANSALSRGHTLLVPRRHVEKIEELTSAERSELGKSLTSVTERVRRLTHDFTVSLNHGIVAGQHVPHIHFHIIPRYPTGVLSLAPGIAWGYDAPRERVPPSEAQKLRDLLH